MDLKTFVSESLKQIIDGVRDAQEHASKHDARVVPLGTVLSLSTGKRSPSDQRPQTDVSFDIAVTATEESAKQTGGGLKVAVISAGRDVETKSGHESVSRVKFDVTVQLPVQK